jgi:hypothetical protein
MDLTCTEGPTVDIGCGVTVERRYINGELSGIAYHHACAKGANEGYVAIEGEYCLSGHGWHLESEEPLTISPSLLCRACGHHGFIRDGKWVPA